jgi:hypothetical protein
VVLVNLPHPPSASSSASSSRYVQIQQKIPGGGGASGGGGGMMGKSMSLDNAHAASSNAGAAVSIAHL